MAPFLLPAPSHLGALLLAWYLGHSHKGPQGALYQASRLPHGLD